MQLVLEQGYFSIEENRVSSRELGNGYCMSFVLGISRLPQY